MTPDPAGDSTPRLFHIALRDDWERSLADGHYCVSTLGRSLDEVGFIHLSFEHQVKFVADAYYRGVSDLLLLEIDPDRLSALVRIEAVAGGTERFPHLYGELSPDAVIAARPLVAGSDGFFAPPL